MKVNSFKKGFPRKGVQLAIWNKKYNTWVIDEAGSDRNLMNTSLYDATHWISLPKTPTEKGETK